MEPDNCVVVHWDIQNQSIPCGVSVANVCNRLRAALGSRVISDAFCYVDSGDLSCAQRAQLGELGFDVIDVSSVHRKPGQVDLRIVARALKPSVGPRPAVCIISGDGDYAYAVSTLRNQGVETLLIFDSDRPESVSSVLIEAVTRVLPVSFGGGPASAPVAEGEGEAAADPPPESPVAAAEDAKPDPSAAMLDAVRRAPPCDSAGWKLGPSVGELFHRLCPGSDKPGFRRSKQLLLASGRIEMHKSQDWVREVPPE